MPTLSSAPLSASALANHLACKHLSDLEQRARRGEIERPHWHDPHLELLRERGLEHEAAYVQSLVDAGLEVVDLSAFKGKQNSERVQSAAAAGAGAIVQAHLAADGFHGYADVLLRVERPSRLGGWSYDVVDTKLAQETRAATLLQLCLYADLVGDLQGEPAHNMTVVKPGDGFAAETFRYGDYEAYYRLVRRNLAAFVRDDGRAEIYPTPVPHCEVCRWWKRCDDRRRADDHLSLVAGMPRTHALEFERQGRGTLQELGEAQEALDDRPRHGSLATYNKLQDQARVQVEGRSRGERLVELLAPEPERGLARLPEPSEGDIYLDFEGNRYVDDGGLEYLTGYAFRDAAGALHHEADWAHGRRDEKRAFERFVDFTLNRMAEHPGLHIYHFAPYETAALRRLAMRHATREDELDRLLRAKRFIDLHAVTRQGVRMSTESYSLKPLEAFFGYVREVDLEQEASPALRRVGHALEHNLPAEIRDEDRVAVAGYNRDDCLSLVALQRWLEEQRRGSIADGADIERPPLQGGDAREEAEQRSEEVAQVFDALVAGVADDPRERSGEEEARWLLAHLLEYFHREQKVSWWEYYARLDAELDDLIEDRKAVIGLVFEEDLGKQGRDRLPTHRYRFPPQELSLKREAKLFQLGVTEEESKISIGSVTHCDPSTGVLDIKKTKATIDLHPRDLHIQESVRPSPLDRSLLELGRWVATHGIDDESSELRAGRDLLLRCAPRTRTPFPSLVDTEAKALTNALAAARDLDGGLLAIQGPPGAGKTYTGARLIVELAQAGHRVGLSATSHKVIVNLLEAAQGAAREQGTQLRCARKPGSNEPRADNPDDIDAIQHVSNDTASTALDQGVVVGGTAWLWARDDMEQRLDYLFIDEAGQMSLAHVLACARATKNLILLGDPRQLQQPQRGAHPEGAEVSALDHLLGDHATMPRELGLFLAQTWRLPPQLCAYTSEAFYERRLTAHPDCARQQLHGTPFAGTGLFVVHSDHEANQSVSHEEVETVANIVEQLLTSDAHWTDRDGAKRPLKADDVLIIAPYNAQVGALHQRLPNLAVGTVDKFQGQERPVVIYSMTSSSAAEAPRGMSFLYDPHRLNVATSRAQCVCILVGTRALFAPECRTPQEIRWANGVCRYGEMAKVVGSAT